MGQGIKALALGAMLAVNSIAADAAVWKIEGFFNFGFEPCCIRKLPRPIDIRS